MLPNPVAAFSNGPADAGTALADDPGDGVAASGYLPADSGAALYEGLHDNAADCSTADADAAISKAATDAGVDDDIDGDTTTNVGTPTTTASGDDESSDGNGGAAPPSVVQLVSSWYKTKCASNVRALPRVYHRNVGSNVRDIRIVVTVRLTWL